MNAQKLVVGYTALKRNVLFIFIVDIRKKLGKSYNNL